MVRNRLMAMNIYIYIYTYVYIYIYIHMYIYKLEWIPYYLNNIFFILLYILP